ncbi:MAG: hypothetical protein LBQ76_00575 [Candidatus Fibromonas sp.]|jgi:uncharacterized protein (TIGR02145 family)|nr:hypothetical protein [Candidatus Fibromonas sp.]
MKTRSFLLAAGVMLAMAFTFSCSSDDGDENGGGGGGGGGGGNGGSGSVSHGGQKYKTVKIGNQTWFAENLNYAGNDNSIGVCYDNAPANCTKYGRLYNISEAMSACPDGWHLPSRDEWTILMCGGKTKEDLLAKNGWNNGNNGTDKYGFSALPGGRSTAVGGFNSLGQLGVWRSTSMYTLVIGSNAGEGDSDNDNDESLFSVRCLKDETIAVVHGKSVNYGNETYPTVVIGTQTWFAKNLNYEVEGSRCYGDDPANCGIYGRLYDWETAKTVCPSGWHLPSKEEWDNLTCNIGSDAGKLKATSGWNYGNGTDDYGFSALPGGNGYSDGSFSLVGIDGNWWSANEHESMSDYAYYRYMGYSLGSAGWNANYKSILVSVRCLQD